MYEYVCMHACMHVCVYVCMYVCMHACMYACMHVCMHVRQVAARVRQMPATGHLSDRNVACDGRGHHLREDQNNGSTSGLHNLQHRSTRLQNWLLFVGSSQRLWVIFGPRYAEFSYKALQTSGRTRSSGASLGPGSCKPCPFGLLQRRIHKLQICWFTIRNNEKR